MSDPSQPDTISVSAERHIEAACVRFEDAWQAGRRPAVEAYLDQVPPEARTALLRELLQLDLHYRRLNGEQPTVEDYRQWLPADAELLGQLLPPTSPAVHADTVDQNPAVRPAGPSDVLFASRYRVLATLGRGGMGIVYHAQDVSLNREVAVKTIPGADVPREAVARFWAEAEAMAAVRHPHVVPVYELGEHGGRPFMAMEFVSGGSLAGRLKAGPLTPGAAAGLLEKVARGVAAAHELGIVHRDLKPANVLLDAAGEPKVSDFGLAKRRSADLTRTQALMGTPAYMAPEQAAGRAKFVGPQADVWSLGVILYECVAGARPFDADTAEGLLAQIQSAEPTGLGARVRGVPRDLNTIVSKCLAKEPERRYPTAADLADELARFVRGEPIAARPVGNLERVWKWVKRKPSQAALAVVGVLVVVGVAIGGWAYQREREATRAAARAESLVQGLATADTAGVPRIVADLAEVRVLTRPRLVEMAAGPITEKPGLHARLALLADEPQRAAELAAYVPTCKAEELLTIREFLMPHASGVAPGLWVVLSDERADAGRRVRAAGALAGLTRADPRWAAVAAAVAEAVVRSAPGEFVVWAAALEPVRVALLPPLMTRYPRLRAGIEAGRLATPELVAEATAFDLTADLLARYTFDRPGELAELALLLDGRHYRRFASEIRANRAGVVPWLTAELGRPGLHGGYPVGAAMSTPVLTDALNPDPVLAEAGKRKGYTAAALLALGEAESVWPVFRFPADGDPTARSHLLARVGSAGVDPVVLVRRFDAEDDLPARRALVIALGEFPPDAVLAAQREPFVARLMGLYREHPDPGLHGAIDWLLRQRWGKAKELDAIDTELAAAARRAAVTRALADVVVPVGGVPVLARSLLPAPAVAEGKDWYVNGEGQTFLVVRGPVEFMMGSPRSEPGRFEGNEHLHPKRISRTFAIATKEVTVEQFLRFRPDHSWTKRYSPGPDTPAVSMTWYAAAKYCNWLSEQEGIPPDQWCYEPNKEGEYKEGMRMKPGHLKLTGYRLPREAEWEFVCRGGAVTSRYYGRGEELLPRYGWFTKNSDEHAWSVGRLRPNELGLFDALGNAMEWCEDPGSNGTTDQREDIESARGVLIDESLSRMLRGGSIFHHPAALRCANRIDLIRPSGRDAAFGFRPARTLPR